MKENKANDRILKLGKIWVFYRRHTDSKWALKRSWISLVIREIQWDKLQWDTWDIMSIQSLTRKCSQQPQTENNLHVHWKWMNKQTVIYPYIYNKRQVILPEKEWKFALCNNMDGFKRYGDGQGGLACCDSWGGKELNTAERLNWTELMQIEIKEINMVSFYLYVESKKQMSK